MLLMNAVGHAPGRVPLPAVATPPFIKSRTIEAQPSGQNFRAIHR